MRTALNSRLALPEDIAVLRPLMNDAIGQLLRDFLPPEAVEASFHIMGLDPRLIDDGTYFVIECDGTYFVIECDGTYFVIECDGAIAGCGGWSRRATLFGGDHTVGRSDALLDPAIDAARIRAMYTSPSFTRRGVGRLVLELCEKAAAAEGFARVELAATMGGVPLYRACGYQDIEPFEADTPSGVRVPLIRMGKRLDGA